VLVSLLRCYFFVGVGINAVITVFTIGGTVFIENEFLYHVI
jgi:hypothetical protein